MSLKCSLFGHSFGQPDVQRERVEEGSEVVTTITEVATCDRCGTERVVAENTEVTTLETPESDAETASANNEDSSTGDTESTDTVDESATDAEIIETTTDEQPEGAVDHPADDVAQVGSDEPDAPPEEDTGVIVDEESDSAERDHGQWPEASEGDEPDWVSETAPTPVESETTSSARIDGTGSALTVPNGEFVCPDCGFTTSVDSTSLRAGDYCPECQHGTLNHRPGGD